LLEFLWRRFAYFDVHGPKLAEVLPRCTREVPTGQFPIASRMRWWKG
jgi:hypothetical protein